jgi:hypothetical protein
MVHMRALHARLFVAFAVTAISGISGVMAATPAHAVTQTLLARG